MTRRNDKRNNTPELPPFAQMLCGAIVGKGVDMIAKKMAEISEEETPDIHAEGISNQDVTNINNGKATLSKLRIPADGSAVEYPVPDNLQFFFDEEGKLMVRKKIEGEAETSDDKEGNPITYDDILKKLYFEKTAYWLCDKNNIVDGKQYYSTYEDAINCTTRAQAKRLLAFNKLQNIAKYLNNGWKPNFDDGTSKWGIVKDGNKYCSQYNILTNDGSVYFKSEDLANEAIRLMGEESLNDLFSTDW